MQSLIRSSQLVEIPCFTSLPREDLTPLDFRIEKSDSCIDPTHIYLYMRCQIIQTAPATTEETIEFSPVNNLGYSIFQSVDTFINDQKITQDHVLYPWLAYLVCLTQFSEQYRKTALQTSLWFPDLYGTMDTARGDNTGAVKRAEWTQNTFELYSKVITDYIQLPRLLPSQTELLLRFTPAQPSNYLMAAKGTFKLQISDARLYVRKVYLAEPLPKILSYPVSRYQVRAKTVNAGEQNVNWVPFSGCRPRRLFFVQISQKAYNGDITRNPFNLQTFDLKKIQAYFNELSLPLNTATDYAENNAARCYFNTIKAIDNSLAWNVTINEYKYGYFIYAVDLTNDQNANAEYMNATKTGSVRLSVDYRIPLKEAITMICFAEFDDTLIIDEFGNPKWS